MSLGRFRYLTRWAALRSVDTDDQAQLEIRDRQIEDYLSSVGLDIDTLRALAGYIKGDGAGGFTAQAAPIPVADGGTGATSLTSGSYLKGAGTSAITTQAAPIPASDGGTGQAGGYTVGDVLYASGASALSKLAAVATGQALLSGGVATAPAWGAVGLTTHVSGTLPVANGGTGATTHTSGNFLKGAGTGAVTSQSGINVSDINSVAFSSFTISSLTQSSSVSFTANWAWYLQIASVCFFDYKLTVDASGTAGNDIVVGTSGLPTLAFTNERHIGEGLYLDLSAGRRSVMVIPNGSNSFKFNATDGTPSNDLGNDPSFAVASGDTIYAHGWYNTA